jgi:hypothetical protein
MRPTLVTVVAAVELPSSELQELEELQETTGIVDVDDVVEIYDDAEITDFAPKVTESLVRAMASEELFSVPASVPAPPESGIRARVSIPCDLFGFEVETDHERIAALAALFEDVERASCRASLARVELEPEAPALPVRVAKKAKPRVGGEAKRPSSGRRPARWRRRVLLLLLAAGLTATMIASATTVGTVLAALLP